ncbi:sensor histidine kinase [Sulfitobacter sp.]|uniref:sensor histidine kinase n=3 Tax=Sulfitobacter sp. TaxID=1903071 RepID=UPI004059D36E
MNDPQAVLPQKQKSALNLTMSVAILAPRGRDAEVARQLLDKENIASVVAPSVEKLTHYVQNQIGAVLVAEEALIGTEIEALQHSLQMQPPWSDVPFIVLANGTASSRSAAAKLRMDALRNAVLLSRPLHAEELVRAIRSALNARTRQYEARERMVKLEFREQQLYESEAKFHAIADSVDQMIWSTLPDGYHDYYNRRWYEFTGVPDGSTDGEAWNGMFHPDDQERAWSKWRHSLATGDPYEIEYRLKHRSGDYRWVLGRAQPVRSSTGEIIRWYGSCTDIHKIKIAEEQRQLMLAEMNHRVKNTLAMVHAIVSQTLRQADSLQDAQASIQSRIGMMAQAHDRLIQSTWTETKIDEVVEAALVPHRSGQGHFKVEQGHFKVEGPDLPIGSKQALALTMALHELATNAAKYGALSIEAGKIHIYWDLIDQGENAVFEFNWVESNGPKVEQPSRRGFGSRMIEQALAGYFNGSAELSYKTEGLSFVLKSLSKGLTD